MNPGISEQARAEYAEVAAGLESAGVVTGSMFGNPCLKIGRKMVAGLFGDAMVFKLPPEPRERALDLPGAQPFDPGMGRAMREWVLVPLAQADSWPEFAELALEYVRE
ncbi:TfoX-like protein [Kribbella amoyensis]|uniref:TfoX-like protein n=1 Tax=Kribbella amoyensis TaxID=996641 RepID=A0A561B8F7_9ACTN|nr:TfoX/Sxy family protein [Kribbella amoyensis]TWD75245.1 TfoX-like protein [Kribbella amoyensis]